MKIERVDKKSITISVTSTDFPELDLALESLKKFDHDSTFIVQFPRTLNLDCAALVQKIGPTKFCQFGMRASSSDLIHFEDNSHASVSVVPEIERCNNALIREAFVKSFETDFLSKWHSYLGKQMVDTKRQNVAHITNFDNSIAFARSGSQEHVCAMMVNGPSMDCYLSPVEQIYWIWIDQAISGAARSSIKREFVRYLASYPQSTQFQAGVHLLNVRSQSFFKSIGFSYQCMHIYGKNTL
jgi:hypothetical protein